MTEMPRITVSMAGDNYRLYRDGQWIGTFPTWGEASAEITRQSA